MAPQSVDVYFDHSQIPVHDIRFLSRCVGNPIGPIKSSVPLICLISAHPGWASSHRPYK